MNHSDTRGVVEWKQRKLYVMSLLRLAFRIRCSAHLSLGAGDLFFLLSCIGDCRVCLHTFFFSKMDELLRSIITQKWDLETRRSHQHWKNAVHYTVTYPHCRIFVWHYCATPTCTHRFRAQTTLNIAVVCWHWLKRPTTRYCTDL